MEMIEARGFDLNRSLRIIFVIPLIAVVLLISILVWQIFQLVEASGLVAKTHQIISQAESVQRQIVDAETGLRGFLLNKDPVFLEPYIRAEKAVPESFAVLSEMVTIKSQDLKVNLIRERFEEWHVFSRYLINLEKSGQGAEVLKITKLAFGKKMMDEIRSIVDVFQVQERKLLEDRSRNRDHALYATLFSAAVLGFFTVAFISLSAKRAINRVVNVFTDAIHERKNAEDALIHTNKNLEHRVIERTKELETKSQELEAFSYSVSHDLRAPLRTMDGFSQLLLEKYEGVLDAKGKDYLSRIRTASQDMARLIDDLLTLARISRSDINKNLASPGAMVNELCEQFRQNHPDRKIHVEIEGGEKVWLDESLARIALTNILDNAFKYSSKKPETRISFKCVDPDAPAGKIFCISDNGVGFDMAHYPQLFKPFQRLHAAREFFGTGIGLATVKRVMERHDGFIRAESKVSEGTTFYFSFGRENSEET